MAIQHRMLAALIPLSGSALIVGTLALAPGQARQGEEEQPDTRGLATVDANAVGAASTGLAQPVPTVRYVDPGPGVDTRLNMPDVSSAATSSDPVRIGAVAPELRISLAGAGLSERWAVLLQLPDARFSGEARYGDATGRELVIVVWTPDAKVEWVALKDSPVRRFEEGTLGTWHALIMLPTKDVIGSGPRDVLFATSNHVVWVHGEGFPDDANFLAIAGRVAQEAK
jgi:hypothetical protein